MEEITLWFKISVGLFAGFLIMLIYSMVKQQLKTIYFSLVLLLLSLCSGAYTAYILGTKSYHKFKDLSATQKKDKDTYERLFGKTDHFCLRILAHDTPDGDVTVESDVTGLHFYTCPEEMQRILNGISHTTTTVSANSIQNNLHPPWIQLSSLGDSVRVFSKVSGSGEAITSRIIYSSLDSTQAYYINIYRETSF